MKSVNQNSMILFVLTALLLTAAEFQPPQGFQVENPNPPDHVVKLIFIHHSTGENLLRDDYGGLGRALGENNYFVSDTNYGWGPDAIGDRTDIPNWTEWFASEGTPRYLSALFNESGQNADYTRTLDDPGGENAIIIIKSCFPNSALEGSPNESPDPADLARVAAGELAPWEPQPYAVVDINERLFFNPSGVEQEMIGAGDQRRYRIGDVAYDRQNNLLYVLELFADGAKPVVHAWRIR